jgi:hypothetical protein
LLDNIIIQFLFIKYIYLIYMINFNDISIVKTLGSGMFGTTYLAKYKNNKYALKIQHILPSDRNKSYKKQFGENLIYMNI